MIFLIERFKLTYGCDDCGDCNDGFPKDPDWSDFVFLTPSIVDIFWVELIVKMLKHVAFTWGNGYSNMKALPVQMIDNNSQSYKHEIKKATKCCHPDSFSIVCPSGWPEIRKILISVDLLWPNLVPHSDLSRKSQRQSFGNIFKINFYFAKLIIWNV